jgi:hypothetical protein
MLDWTASNPISSSVRFCRGHGNQTPAKTKVGATRADEHDLQITGESVLLDLYAPRQMEEKQFQIKGELLAEMWQNAARHWTERHDIAFTLPNKEAKENSVAGAESVTLITA